LLDGIRQLVACCCEFISRTISVRRKGVSGEKVSGTNGTSLSVTRFPVLR
jgi:hypothetical protein